MQDYLKILKNRDFLLLWLGQSVSNIGNVINYIGLTWLVIDFTGKATSVSILFVFLTLPSILIGPWAGVYVDRWSKKKIIVIADIIRGFLAFGMAVTGSMQQIYVLALTQAVITCFFSPAIQVSIPKIVKKENLITANSLSSATRNISNLCGPALAGLLIGLFNIKSVFVINGISFLISAFSELWIDIPENNLTSKKKKNFFPFKDLIEGWNYIRQTRIVKFVIVFFAISMLPMGALPVLNVVLIKEVFNLSAQSYGLLMSIEGIGLLAGSLFMGKWGKKFPELSSMIVFCGFYGLGYFLLSLTNIFILATIFFTIIGITATSVNIAYGTYLQKNVKEEVRGRVFSLDIAIGNGTGLLSMSSAGILADSFGTLKTIQFGGISLVILAIFSLIFLKRQIYSIKTCGEVNENKV